MRKAWSSIVSSEDGRGAKAKECGEPLEAKVVKETDYLLGPPERTQPCLSLILANGTHFRLWTSWM